MLLQSIKPVIVYLQPATCNLQPANRILFVIMILIHPPMAKPGEPPAGITRLAGFLENHGQPCTLLDANLEALLFLVNLPIKAADTWSRRCLLHRQKNLVSLRNKHTYTNRDRYARAVNDLNHLVELTGQPGLLLSMANYQDSELSPLNSHDLLKAADNFEHSIFYPYFAERLSEVILGSETDHVGFSLNYLSQALSTFAMVGYVRKYFPRMQIVLGGGLVTSWMRAPSWKNPFTGLVDYMISGPGESPLLEILTGKPDPMPHCPDFQGLPLDDYLAPGLILPYAASSGCYWNKCTFCPEKAEENPYTALPEDRVLNDLDILVKRYKPVLVHFLDNAVSPRLMKRLCQLPPGVSWYGFARVSPHLADVDFCQNLRRSGCVMLKLGLESGDQQVLDSMEKGIDLGMVSQALSALREAGIATYVYLLFGTPGETVSQARRTLEFTVRHNEAITFLNLAIFNMPIAGPDSPAMGTGQFYEGDLSLYTSFDHPVGWDRGQVRQFLDREFKRHPVIAGIIRRDPPIFTSNHAPFFVMNSEK